MAGRVEVLYGNPLGRFDHRVQSIPAPGGALFAGLGFGRGFVGRDFTGDGYADVVIRASARLHLYTGGPTGLRYHSDWRPAPYDALDMPACAPGDFNGDGLTDLVFEYNVYPSHGASGFNAADVFNIGGRKNTSSPGDVDGDGLDDIDVGQFMYATSALPDLNFLDVFLGGITRWRRPVASWGNVFPYTACGEQ